MQTLPQTQSTSLLAKALTARNARLKKQHGFTLVELAIVLVIIALLIGALMTIVPRVLMNGRNTTGVSEMVRAMTNVRANAANTGSSTPFATISTAEFATVLRGGSVFKVIGSGPTSTISHALSYLANGAVTVAPATIATAGDAYAVSITLANSYTCPDFLAGLDSVTTKMQVNGTTVKDAAGGVAFNALTAGTSCTLLDTNTYVLTGN